MKCEPKVMKYFSTIHTSFAINFVFSNNITIVFLLFTSIDFEFLFTNFLTILCDDLINKKITHKVITGT